MKRLVPVLALLLASPLAAQEVETVLSEPTAHGGFGGPVMAFTSVRGQFGVMLGGRGGWIINHQFVIGGRGAALVGTGIDAPFAGPAGEPMHMAMEYGGVELQYIHRPNKVAHLTAIVLMGGGNARFQDGTTLTSDQFFVAEPAAMLTVNLTRTVHFNVGASWRLVSGVTMPGLTAGDLSGLSGLWSVEFGHF